MDVQRNQVWGRNDGNQNFQKAGTHTRDHKHALSAMH